MRTIDRTKAERARIAEMENILDDVSSINSEIHSQQLTRENLRIRLANERSKPYHKSFLLVSESRLIDEIMQIQRSVIHLKDTYCETILKLQAC